MLRFSIEEKILLSCVLPTPVSRMRLVALTEKEVDWSYLVQLAEQALLTPLVRFNLAAAGLLSRVPTVPRQQLEFSHQAWSARQLGLMSEALRLLHAFDQAGVTAMPLKGAALLLSQCYPQPGLRASLDLDLLVDPRQIEKAEAIVERFGYGVMPGRTAARPRQRLANELNHVAPRRSSASGVILELHTRAFHFVRGELDYGFAEMYPHAERRLGADGKPFLLPAPYDLALHLIHHTLVDLQSTRSILRTLADLYFLFTQVPECREELQFTAARLGFGNVIHLADETLLLLATLPNDEWNERFAQQPDAKLLIETALLPQPRPIADAARLFEYFDFSRQPGQKIANLFSLFFTNRAHLNQLYGGAPTAPVSRWHYMRRPFDLVRKFNWECVHPQVLRRVWQLRQNVR